MASDITTFETGFDTSEGYRPQRMDAVERVRAHRVWSVEAKARIIAESFEPGANVAAIARANRLAPQQLYNWRSAMRKDQEMSFVPVVVDRPGGSAPVGCAGEIVIHAGAMTIHVPESVTTEHIGRVLLAARQVA